LHLFAKKVFKVLEIIFDDFFWFFPSSTLCLVLQISTQTRFSIEKIAFFLQTKLSSSGTKTLNFSLITKCIKEKERKKDRKKERKKERMKERQNFG
jgi:hypothetical protein